MKIGVMTLVAGFALSFALSCPAADFDGDSRDDIAIFRPVSGLWAIRGVTRAYYGATGDEVVAGDYDGDGIADIGIFRGDSGLWGVRGITRVYFGSDSDTAIAGGSGQRTYDYVVKPGDGADLVRALESDTYQSVFIPNGTYEVSEIITIDNVARVTGENMNSTVIEFSGDGYYLDINMSCCLLEDFAVHYGGSTLDDRGAIHIRVSGVKVNRVSSYQSFRHGFSFTGYTYEDISFSQARAYEAAAAGFKGDIDVESTFTNCQAVKCQTGFHSCRNLSSCVVRWYSSVKGPPAPISSRAGAPEEIQTLYGFSLCDGLSSCRAVNCATAGFWMCRYVSASNVAGGTYGFALCSNLSSCHVEGTSGDEYYDSVGYVDAGSCD